MLFLLKTKLISLGFNCFFITLEKVTEVLIKALIFTTVIFEIIMFFILVSSFVLLYK